MESDAGALGERERNGFIDLQAKGPQHAPALETRRPDREGLERSYVTQVQGGLAEEGPGVGRTRPPLLASPGLLLSFSRSPNCGLLWDEGC